MIASPTFVPPPAYRQANQALSFRALARAAALGLLLAAVLGLVAAEVQSGKWLESAIVLVTGCVLLTAQLLPDPYVSLSCRSRSVGMTQPGGSSVTRTDVVTRIPAVLDGRSPGASKTQAYGHSHMEAPAVHCGNETARQDYDLPHSRATQHPEPTSESVALHACFQLTYMETDRVIRTFARESSALGFVRDVVVFGSRGDAAQFRLQMICGVRAKAVAEGEPLVRRALEDGIL